ncbi:hypothetical protein QFC21_001657 [Naganishia friedmannii]|uniref:Uncharacterized protein n=1 Tax=Naganishia friedmannii TaxID=89922 RepID=A0ACC2W1V1_9TREE|nr:hypothetical protein QFC21_001657 [Naganishia friedmannii]
MLSAVAVGRRLPSTCSQCRLAVKPIIAHSSPIVASFSRRSLASSAAAVQSTDNQDLEIHEQSERLVIGTEKPASDSNIGKKPFKAGKGKEKGGSRLSKKQKKALENSRALAESLARSRKIGGQAPSSALKPAETLPLAETTSASDPQASPTPAALTIEILHQYKPTRSPPIRAHIDKYTKEYGRAYQRLDKAFVRDQLWELWKQLRLNLAEAAKLQALVAQGQTLELPPPPTPRLPNLSAKTGKRQIIQSILDQWGWQRVEQVERERQAQLWKNVISEKDIPMTHAEAYLLLRRDPDFTQVLASEHRVALNMVLRPNLCFHVKGKNYILQEIEVAIDKRRKLIKVQRMNKQDVPGGSITELYQTISNMSGSFLETDVNNKLQISYLDPECKERAVELLYRAHVQLEEDPKAAHVLALTGQEEHSVPSSSTAAVQTPQTYALYPFCPVSVSINSPLDSSLAMESTNDWPVTGKSVFRLRRLGGWFGSVGHNEDAAALPELEKTLARNVRNVQGQKAALLRDWLRDDSPPVELDASSSAQYERNISIQQGHLLYSAPGAQERATLTPPGKLQGDHSLGAMCRRLESLEMHPVFIPSSALPFESAIAETSTPKRKRRVRYRSTLKRLDSDWLPTIEIEVPLKNVKSMEEGMESPSIPDAASEPVGDSTNQIAPVVKHAYERSWHILCPDRYVSSALF